MKRTMGRKGFTLIELLVVIGIISILGGLILTAVAAARTRGRKTNCTSNMRQIFLSIHTYQLSFPRPGQSEVYPYRINLLNTAKIRFIATPKVMLCPLDPTKGQQGGKPSSASSQYAELDEKNPNLSYMYEFSGAQCTWTWSGYVGIGAQTYASSVTQLPFMHDPRGEASRGYVKTAQYNYCDSHLHT
jgi:prepilin-type N-terminal cleavage/methylation domain-containing protein